MAFEKLVDADALGRTLLDGYSVKGISGLSVVGGSMRFSWTDDGGATRTSDAPLGIPGNAEIDARIAAPAREGNTDAWAASKLPYASSSADGIVEDEDYEKIQSAIQANDLHSTPELMETMLEDDDAFLLDDASISTGSELREIRYSQLKTGIDKRIAAPAREGNTTAWAASKLPLATDTGSGIIDSTEHKRINNSIDAAHLHDTPVLRETELQDDDAFLLDDASIVGAGESQLREVRYSELKKGLDKQIATTARFNNRERWSKDKLPSDTIYSNTQRFTTALLAKLNALPNAADIRFENHPVGTAAALNALSRTTDALDFVSVTAAIASGITANTVVDGSGSALTSLAAGDLLVLDHDDDRWVRVVNLPATSGVSQSTVRGFIDGDFVEGLLAGLSGANRLSYSSLKETPTIPAAQVSSDWDATTGIAQILNKPTLAPANAEQNVQSDWTETDSADDSFIQNKPTIPTLPASVTQAEAEAGTATANRLWSAERVKQAIAALASRTWASITGKPATATRWPTYSEVTGTKPPANAEQNVQSDWNAASGDAFIQNKPTLVTAFTGLSDTPAALTGQAGKVVKVNSGASALEFAEFSASSARSFLVDVHPTATVSQTTTGSDVYVDYETLMTAPAITAAQAGIIKLGVHIHARRHDQHHRGAERG